MTSTKIEIKVYKSSDKVRTFRVSAVFYTTKCSHCIHDCREQYGDEVDRDTWQSVTLGTPYCDIGLKDL